MPIAIAEARKRLSELVKRVQAGETVILLRHGHPAARLLALRSRGKPWRVQVPDDPHIYRHIDLDKPLFDEIS